MKTYFITGVAGFVGSHLCDFLLDKGFKVVGIDNFCNFYNPDIKRANIAQALRNPNFTLLECDLRDPDAYKALFERYTFDCVIHMAAMAGVRPSIENPQAYWDVNVTGTLRLLELLKEYNVKKFICASSSSVYGNNKKVPFSEEDTVDFAISPYAATKKSCEVMAHTYHHLYDIDTIMLRFFTVYGPRQRPDLAIHKFARLMLEGRDIPIFGDGSTRRDYTYITDIIDGIYKSVCYLENGRGIYEIINLGESRAISLAEMVSQLEKALGIKARLKMLPMQPGDVIQTFADVSKAKRLLGYNPSVPFEQGINNFVQWLMTEKTCAR